MGTDLAPFAGSGLVGYAIGFALKKTLKLMLIIAGLAGMFFVGVQLLQNYGYFSTVNRSFSTSHLSRFFSISHDDKR